MAHTRSLGGSYVFGRFRLSADGTLLVRDGVRVPLAPKVLQTLLVLVQRAGQVVKKSDLQQAVWPDSYVEETGLTRNISVLRQALGDDAQAAIVTVARVGYRFTAQVALVDSHADERNERQLTRLLVLPFRILRSDPETDFLGFSVPDAIVNTLSGVGSLVVRSSAAAARFQLDDLDLKQLAVDADVDAVVIGTLLRSGRKIRVTTQLAAVPCGTVLWSQSFQLTLRDVFELQDNVVTSVLRALPLSLTASEQRRLKGDVPNSPAAYEFFLRGNEAVGPQGIKSASNLRVARELYARSVEEDPGFAPAWARFGRCLYLIGKADENRTENLARAEWCFQKALALSPDLPLAHNLYALLEIDHGRARSAMVRLLSRVRAGSAEPELYAALVQACRFCGLLEASIAAHERARALDPAIATGGYQALWQLGEEDRALREGIRPYLLRAIVTGMRGAPEQALAMLHELEAHGPTTLLRHLILSLRGVFEGRPDVAFQHAQCVFDAYTDPESLYFAGRFIAAFGDRRALPQFARALEGGFVIYRVLQRVDPWLDPLRSTSEFRDLVERSREVYRECLQAYVDSDGERLLGRVPEPEEVEGGMREQSRLSHRAAER